MNKAPCRRVLVGSIGSLLNLSIKEIDNRLNNPEKYYKNNTLAFESFLNSVCEAEQTLQKLCEEKQNIYVCEKDKDYIFDFYKSYDGIYVCYYKLIDIEPS